MGKTLPHEWKKGPAMELPGWKVLAHHVCQCGMHRMRVRLNIGRRTITENWYRRNGREFFEKNGLEPTCVDWKAEDQKTCD